MVSSGYCTSCMKVVRLTHSTEGRELVTGGSSPGAAGREIGVCASTVRKWARQSGLSPSRRGRRGGIAGVVAAEIARGGSGGPRRSHPARDGGSGVARLSSMGPVALKIVDVH